jgi:apolipoprotein N-acyltransferase
MKEMTLGTLIAVFEEMFGAWLFWGLVAAAALVTLAYLFVLVRDRAVSWRKFLLAQVAMPFGAVAAVVFTFWITNSGLRDIGGPIDAIVLLGVAVLGAVGAAILVYSVQSLIWRPEDDVRANGRRHRANPRAPI